MCCVPNGTDCTFTLVRFASSTKGRIYHTYMRGHRDGWHYCAHYWQLRLILATKIMYVIFHSASTYPYSHRAHDGHPCLLLIVFSDGVVSTIPSLSQVISRRNLSNCCPLPQTSLHVTHLGRTERRSYALFGQGIRGNQKHHIRGICNTYVQGRICG